MRRVAPWYSSERSETERVVAVSLAAVVTLVGVVAEAVADVQSATVVRDDAAGEPARAAGAEAYVLTVAERDACLRVLSELLFTAVDTPTSE